MKLRAALEEISRLEAVGDTESAIELLSQIYPRLKNRASAELWLARLLSQNGRIAELPKMLAGLREIRPAWQQSLIAVAFVLPLVLILLGYTAFFMLRWEDFISGAGGIERLRKIYEENRRQPLPTTAAQKRDKDQEAAEKILSENFRRRFETELPAKEHYIMEDSYFDRYPQVYFGENRHRNFIRLTKNLSHFRSSSWEQIVPDYQKQLLTLTDPLLKFRFLLEIAYNFALYDNLEQSYKYLNQALNQPVEQEFLRDAWFLKASLLYQEKKYREAQNALSLCSEPVFFEAEMLAFLCAIETIDRHSLSAYLAIDQQLLRMINRLNGDTYYLQYLYDEIEKIRRESTDPMTIFLGGEILYAMGNLDKARLYFREYQNSESRVNFITFKKAAREMERKIIAKDEGNDNNQFN